MRVLFIFLLAHLAIAQNTLPQICAGLNNLSGCKASFPVPSGLKLITKTKTENVYNKCKKKVQETVKCPTKREPRKTCKKLKCVGGWDKKTTSVPTGLQILTKQVNLCQTVRSVLGTALGQRLIKWSDPICRCFAQVQAMSSAGRFNSISTKGELTLANTNIITEAVKLQTCVANSGISVKDSKASIAKELKSAGEWVVAPAAEIDLVTYKNMIAAANACQTGTCNQNVIRNTFTPYLTQTNKLMVKPVTGILTGWHETLGRLQQSTLRLDELSGELEAGLETVQPLFEASKQVICEELNRCEGEASDILTAVDHLWQIRGPLDEPSSQIYGMLDHTADAINMLSTLPTTNTLVSTIQQGKFKKVSDIFQIIPIATAMPALAKEIRTGLEPVKEAVVEYDADSDIAFEGLRDLYLNRWEDDYPSEFTTEDSQANQRLLEEFRAIQETMNTNLYDALYKYSNEMVMIRLELKGFSVTNGKFATENKVASYQLWSTLDMDMPCSKTETKTFEKSGFKKKHSWKKYYKCRLGPLTAYYPKHHNPYIRIRGGSGIDPDDL
ncbi:hypothetical protein FZEAL_245 [Fusarium zealandicum]|uniref:Uncharacterized protein n=1 Tax=Fusarium zealandicum TaxID=1053134 RepID=A0A8H4XPX6_9HYPO|nr:hypothetical protein FZEAL_245 [Fusarium zealandicum]